MEDTSAATLQQFVYDHTEIGATVYTDEAAAYRGLVGLEHETVQHSVWEYGQVHTNGISNGRC